MGKSSRPPERVIVEATERYFRSMGISDHVSEAPAGARRIDLVCMDTRCHEYHAIEAKVDSPTHAFTQASRYRFFANYCYVALLGGDANRRAIQLAQDSGVGLILVRWKPDHDMYEAELAIAPKRSASFLPELGDFVWRSAL